MESKAMIYLCSTEKVRRRAIDCGALRPSRRQVMPLLCSSRSRHSTQPPTHRTTTTTASASPPTPMLVAMAALLNTAELPPHKPLQPSLTSRAYQSRRSASQPPTFTDGFRERVLPLLLLTILPLLLLPPLRSSFQMKTVTAMAAATTIGASSLMNVWAQRFVLRRRSATLLATPRRGGLCCASPSECRVLRPKRR